MEELWRLIISTDEYLVQFAATYPQLIYVLLFAIIFAESGILFFAFLPGDGLLLAVGIIAASGAVNIWLITFLLLIAAITGYLLNYRIGGYFGNKGLKSSRFIRPEYWEKSQAFFDRHGDKTVILGRFFPIVRTVVPFMAGALKMPYGKFLKDTIIGALAWILGFVWTGYLFGEIPLVQQNFFLIYLGLVVITMIPLVWASLRKVV